MANVRVELNRRGVGEILKGAEVAADLRRRAAAVAATAGPGHEVEVSVSSTRARASVRTVTVDAMLAEALDRNLTRAFDAARG
jgi:hypothetical protein